VRVLRSQQLLAALMVTGLLAAPLSLALKAQEVQVSPGPGETPVPQSSSSAQEADSVSPTPSPQTGAENAQTEMPSASEDQGAPDLATQAQDQNAQAESDADAASVDTGTLPHDLSPWGMFMAADIVVQAVIIGLVIASIVTWTVWLAKSLELWLAKRRTRRALAMLVNEPSLAVAAAELGNQRGVVPAFIDAATTELRLSQDLSDKAGIKERIGSRLEGLQIAAARQINMGTGLLATIGATAPFVGLFGTVWGIMNSFIGISKAQTTNLAVVAPGIAEALLATALGLAAAIPAVIIYNHFARSIGDYRALVADAAAEIMRQVSRDLDSGAAGRKRGIQRAAE